MEGKKEITDYIKKAKAVNTPEKQIVDNLIKTGWQQEDINEVLKETAIIEPPIPPYAKITEPVSSHHSMWDAFEHTLMFISLYVMATSLALILHAFVDKWVPSSIASDSFVWMSSFQSTLIRGYLAALIVSYPLFAFFFLRITKRTIVNSSLRNLKSRKTLIYITLVGTFLIVIFNIISTVYTLLNGNITSNFFLHLLITLAISSIIFGYYLNQIKEDRNIYA